MSNILDEDKRINLIYHKQNLLFQRLNYFLVGIAFLVTALAAIVSSDKLGHHYDTNVGLIANAICLVGYWLSWFFLVVNFMNSKTIQLQWKSFSENCPPDSAKDFYNFASAPWNTEHFKYLLSDLIIQSVYSFFKPFDQKNKNNSPHTWLVPGLFVLFWGLIWSWLPNNENLTLWSYFFYPLIFLPLLFLIARDCCNYCKSKRHG